MNIDAALLGFSYVGLPLLLLIWAIAIVIHFANSSNHKQIIIGGVIGAVSLSLVLGLFWAAGGFIYGCAYVVCFLPPKNRQIGAGIALALTAVSVAAAIRLDPYMTAPTRWLDGIDATLMFGLVVLPMGRLLAQFTEKMNQYCRKL